MKALRQLLNFYINSSIHVALAVSSLTWMTLIEADATIDKNLLLFNFFAAVTGYNFVKYFGLAKFHHRRLANWLKTIQVFSFFCFLLMVFYAYKLPLKILVYIAGFGLVTFFYAIPFLPKRFFVDKQQNLRSIGGLKIYLIALVWSGVTVFVPIINEGLPVSVNVFIIGLQRYAFVIVLMLPFEIRDLRFDNLKLSTIPQRIGVKRTKIFGIILLVLIVLLEFFKGKLPTSQVLGLFFITALTGVAVWRAKIKQGKYYSAFWVEGLPILWLVLLLLFS